jgi:hypothetical protein
VPTRIPSDDELELAALDFLRQRFLRTDERVAGLLATLERQIDAAPVDDLMTASFKIKNPNATAACGCGTSFSV